MCNEKKGGSLKCILMGMGSSNAYILFGGDSMIENFSFNFRTGANGGIYFGQVAETTRSRFVSFTKQTGSNPRVLISSDVEGFEVMDLTRNQAQTLFTEATGKLWSADESDEYYTLSNW